MVVFIVWIVLIPSKQKTNKKDYCNIVMSSEGTKILEFNKYQKSDKIPFLIYADLMSLIKNGLM